MKKVLSVLAIAALFLVGVTSCTQEKTATELLTQKNGWVLSSATSSPAYHLSDGSFATDLMTEGYLMAWELDDIIVFNENGSHLFRERISLNNSLENLMACYGLVILLLLVNGKIL